MDKIRNRKFKGIIIVILLITAGTIGLITIPFTGTGYSLVGDFFESQDIVFWLNFNGLDNNTIPEDQSIFKHHVNKMGNWQTRYSQLIEDELALEINPNNPDSNYLYVPNTNELNLDFNDPYSAGAYDHMRFSQWLNCPDTEQQRNRDALLMGKYDNGNGQGWKLEMKAAGTNFKWDEGGFRLSYNDISSTPVTGRAVDVFPWAFPEIRSYYESLYPEDLDQAHEMGKRFFYDKTLFVRAGWDKYYFPDNITLCMWVHVLVKDSPISQNYFKTEVAFQISPSGPDPTRPLSNNANLIVGQKFEGTIDEVMISRFMHPLFEGLLPDDPLGTKESREDLTETWNYSLPHQDMIFYYNFESVDQYDSLEYGLNATIFHDGATFNPKNGVITSTDLISNSSWDGSNCLCLDGSTNYGLVHSGINSFSNSIADFGLDGYSSLGRDKFINMGSIFYINEGSDNEMVLLSSYYNETIIQFPGPPIVKHYGYILGLNTDNQLFFRYGIKQQLYEVLLQSPINISGWYKWNLNMTKNIVENQNNSYTVSIDFRLNVYELDFGVWKDADSTTFSYGNVFNDLLIYTPDIIRGGDLIIGATNSNSNGSIKKHFFNGKIDDIFSFKEEAYNTIIAPVGSGINKATSDYPFPYYVGIWDLIDYQWILLNP